MAIAPFPTDVVWASIVIGYRNEELIADRVLRRVRVAKRQFRYLKHIMIEGLTVPDTKVGRRSRPNQVEFSAEDATGVCLDYGLDAPVPNEDMNEAPPGFDPRANALAQVARLIALDREIRTSNLVFALDTYPASQRTTLSGGDRWSQNTSTPIKDIVTARDAMAMRPNVMVLGQAAWSALSTHPDIIKAINRTSGDTGIATVRQVADILELREIIVGAGWVNAAKKGQPDNMLRCWGPHAALLRDEPDGQPEGTATFGFTAQLGEKIGDEIPDKDVGLTGGVRMRAGESVCEVIAAPHYGFFFQNAGDAQ